MSIIVINAGPGPVTEGTHSSAPGGLSERLAEGIDAVMPEGTQLRGRARLAHELADTIMQLPAETLQVLVKALEMPIPAADDQKAALASAVSGGRAYNEAERRALHAATLARAFEQRRRLLADSLSAVEVARLLGTSRQTPHDRLRAATLLGLRDRGEWRFPAWQFDAAGPDGVVPGLPEVLKALHMSPFAQATWLTSPNQELDDLSPLEALRAHRPDEVLRLAAAVGVV
jgi:hypothetical protein